MNYHVTVVNGMSCVLFEEHSPLYMKHACKMHACIFLDTCKADQYSCQSELTAHYNLYNYNDTHSFKLNVNSFNFEISHSQHLTIN